MLRSGNNVKGYHGLWRFYKPLGTHAACISQQFRCIRTYLAHGGARNLSCGDWWNGRALCPSSGSSRYNIFANHLLAYKTPNKAKLTEQRYTGLYLYVQCLCQYTLCTMLSRMLPSPARSQALPTAQLSRSFGLSSEGRGSSSAGDGMPQLLFRNYHDGTATFVSGGTSRREIDGLYVDEYVRYLSDPYFNVRTFLTLFDQRWVGYVEVWPRADDG